jgi:hypothetical protein
VRYPLTLRCDLEEDLCWLASEEHDYPFDFVAICQVLDLNAPWLRNGILNLLAHRLQTHVTPRRRITNPGEGSRKGVCL